MNGTTHTTPPRPVDVTALLPDLAPLARPAIRLHPRPGSPSPYDGSIGGPLLWPADHPWPYCTMWHESTGDRGWDERPGFPLVPVAQLYARDVPLLRSPGGADLLQVLWCPFEHAPEYKPPTALYWRTAAEVTDILAAPPEPSEVRYACYLPKPCVLAPEQITEYPNFLELSEDLRQRLADWDRWQAAGVAVDDSYAVAPEEFYMDELSHAPGWKVGGWAPWGLTDPIARFCIACGARMSPLLTIPSCEWDDSGLGWIPQEDRAAAEAGESGDMANPTGVQISRGNNLQLYACPEATQWHPHTDLIQ
ncbi:hypothetical protein [Embleya sp. NPDC020630]|uniref:hypothetical protein n=1 Tax=Embleya sp. NPDC020630 TaxID=3363979 RepID=UPI0037BB96E8